MMETPFPKSIPFAKKYSRLLEIVKPSDTLGILRNASFYGDAGKTARKIFRPWKGSAGGHRNAARAEIPLENILDNPEDESGLETFVKKILRDMK